ncbi:MAG: hypothetical protein QW548_01185 [Candidatus Aenigmatarchaeota archaeon]
MAVLPSERMMVSNELLSQSNIFKQYAFRRGKGGAAHVGKMPLATTVNGLQIADDASHGERSPNVDEKHG